MNRGIHLVCSLAVVFTTTAFAQTPQRDLFERRIRPVLIERCYECHSSEVDEPEGGLRLDSRDALQRGGDSGPAIVPGDPKGSLLIKAIGYKDALFQMPPDERLPDHVIADFTRWVAGGAEDPRDEDPALASARPKGTSTGAGPGTSIDEGRKWWAFQPLTRHEVTESDDWAQRRIDKFVLAKLRRSHLEPSPQADRRTLIRRVYLDLVGLPPTYKQIEGFITDTSPTAYEDLINRLLDSPRYGERWGRYWLDVARWAEDHPTSESTNPPHRYAWRYRDWIIEAFDNDIPYDTFIRKQFAADLLPGFERRDMRALGYLGNSPTYHKDPRLSKAVIEGLASDDWDERVDAVSRGLLGLTVACARCHDHKFDPITSKDYYGLAGVFASTWLVKRPIVDMSPGEEDQLVRDYERLHRLRGQHQLLPLSTIDPSVHPVANKMKEEIAALKEKLEDDTTPLTHAVIDWGVWIDDSMPTVTWIDLHPGKARDLPVFVRGNVATPGEIVPRRFISVLSEDEPDPFDTGSGRLDLANAIVGRAAPLAARVWVNRVWGWHFGQHLVGTPSDFGTQGEPPTHPELLDDLAARYVDHGWSNKWLHREILLSATWQQASRFRNEAAAVDISNRLLWRMIPKRLDFEAWRDSILHASGELRLDSGGPSEEVDDVDSVRRTVFAKVSRGRLHHLLQMYDFPDANQHSPQRADTTTPLQQLFVLNSDWMQRRSEQLAKRVLELGSPAQQIETLYRSVHAREPRDDETERALSYLVQRELQLGRRPWEELAQVLLGSNEFIYVE